jgi:hypothetical protein
MAWEDTVDWDELLDATDRKVQGIAAVNCAPDDWLPEHDYFLNDDGQLLEDAEGFEQAKDTLEHFILEHGAGHRPTDTDFEYEFRAFLHNDDYSYPPALIAKVLSPEIVEEVLERIRHPKDDELL